MRGERNSGNEIELVPRLALDNTERMSLCQALDRILNTGAVVTGRITVSVADIDLIYLGLNVILSSVETALGSNLETVSEKSKGAERNEAKP